MGTMTRTKGICVRQSSMPSARSETKQPQASKRQWAEEDTKLTSIWQKKASLGPDSDFKEYEQLSWSLLRQ